MSRDNRNSYKVKYALVMENPRYRSVLQKDIRCLHHVIKRLAKADSVWTIYKVRYGGGVRIAREAVETSHTMVTESEAI